VPLFDKEEEGAEQKRGKQRIPGRRNVDAASINGICKPLPLAAAMVFYAVLPLGDVVGSCAFGESYLV